jgi:hypothetical protein
VKDDYEKRGEDLSKYEFVQGEEDEKRDEKLASADQSSKSEPKTEKPVEKKTEVVGDGASNNLGAENTPIDLYQVGENIESVPLPEEFRDTPKDVSPPLNLNVKDFGPKSSQIPKSMLQLNKGGIRDSDMYWTFNQEIGSWTDEASYLLAKFKLAMEIYKRFDFIPGEFKSQHEPKFGRKKAVIDGSNGMDIYPIIDGLNPTEYSTVVDVLQRLATRDVADLSKEEIQVWGHPDEINTMKKFIAINNEFYNGPDIDEMWSFLNSIYSEDEHYTLRRIPENVRRDYLLRPKVGPYECYNQLITSNDFMKPVVTGMVSRIVDEFSMVGVEDAGRTFTEMLSLLEIRVGSFKSKNLIPQQISSVKASSIVRKLIEVKLTSKIAKVSLDIRFDGFSVPTLIDCLTMKLLFAEHEIDSTTVMRIDNYLAKYFTIALPGVKASSVATDHNEIRHNLKNYLKQQFTNGLSGPASVAARNFLATGANGAGWACSGSVKGEYFPTQAKKFVNRDLWYLPVGGKRRDHPEVLTKQMEYFVEFVDILDANDKGLNFKTIDADAGKMVLQILRSLRDRIFKLAEITYEVDKVVEKLGAASIMLPATPLEVKNDTSGKRMDIELDTMSVMSMWFLVDPQRINLKSIPIDLFKTGFAMHHWANELCAVKGVVDLEFKHRRYSKRERMSIVLGSQVSDAGQFSAKLLEVLDNTKNADIAKFPSAHLAGSDFAAKYDLAKAFLERNKRLFGYADSFIYTASATEANSGGIGRYFVDKREPVMRLSWKQMDEFVQMGKMPQIVDVVRNQNNVVRFDVPVKIRLVEKDNNTDQPPVLVFGSTGRNMTLSNLEWYWSFETNHRFNDPNLAHITRNPEYLPVEEPIIFRDHTLIPELVDDLIVGKEGKSVYELFEVVPRSI